MAPRASLPGELFLDAIVIDPARELKLLQQTGNPQDWATVAPFDAATLQRVQQRAPYVALRWALNPALGVPPEPFTVWRRPAGQRDPAQPIPGWHRTGPDTWGWDGVTEMQRIEIDLTGPLVAQGLGRAALDPVQTVSGDAGETVVLDAGPMLGVRLDQPGSVSAVRGQSTVALANGPGWQPFETVGLPFDPGLAATTYYQGTQQGPVGAPTNAFAAAVRRLKSWGPVLGWAPLTGTPPWRPPDPELLVKETQEYVLPGLAKAMTAYPPPLVASQITHEVAHKLDELRQVVGTRSQPLSGQNTSQVTVRPLQSLSAAVACDVWAGLALGFGTGDTLPDRNVARDGYDYMVTALWQGQIRVPVPTPWPWPWLAGGPPQQYETADVERELVAIALAPRPRAAPSPPTPLTPETSFEEGTDDVDTPYRANVVVRTTRPATLPGQPRPSAYGLARFDGPGTGHYALREHPKAKGWIPIGLAEPVRQPQDLPDPELLPGTVMLRDSGVDRPISGSPAAFQYAAAATDLFGQWSAWSTAWLSLAAPDVRTPAVATVRARATAGPGGTDPCEMAVTTEVVWNRQERSLAQLRLAVDIYPPTPGPPAPYDAPLPAPQGGTVTVTDVFLSFAADGTPAAPPAGITVTAVHDDDTPVTPLDPAEGDDRRYRIELSLSAIYGSEPELAVAVYAQAEETVRPGEWSTWSHPREAAIAASPLPPPVPAPLPLVYPERASLPDAAGLSYAPVTWAPTGAWRYRVYEATEAALLAACGKPGPVLTELLSTRMQALFDLHKDPDNLPTLKGAFRKLGADPVLPAPQSDGTMRCESLLPRGSSLIHCYVVAGVSEANVVSAWPKPDADGRKAFFGYAIPRPLQPAQPEITATLDDQGHPRLTVHVGGAVPASALRIHRATNAILARHTGTMEVVATVPTDPTTPASWRTTTFTDATAPVGWTRLQYRVVALTTDDPEHAGMAVPSTASRSYALLNPPPAAPTLTLTPNVPGSSGTTAVVRVDTDAVQRGSDIGDFSLAFTVTAAHTAPVRYRSSLSAVPGFSSASVFAGSGEPAGYVEDVLHLRLDRLDGQPLGLAVDVTDPLDRATHAVIDVPAHVPDPHPVVHLVAVRTGGIAHLSIDTNIPLPPDPAHDWVLKVRTRRASFPVGPPTMRTFAVTGIPTVPTAAGMPDPLLDPADFAIGRIDGTARILMWLRAESALDVALQLTNSDGSSATAHQVTT
ncbi:hypothetical protein [Streptomyces naphthomycinicus]|uniref:hypothetical protein n=1 Tax=Streptomyces naphthomycinicus TaxID=2872625 RepID=UPI001CEC66B1|nr:hypothetical protein [Streptomyces sp. TML10]